MTNSFDYGVDSRYTDKKEKESDSIALMQARLERMKNLSKEQRCDYLKLDDRIYYVKIK